MVFFSSITQFQARQQMLCGQLFQFRRRGADGTDQDGAALRQGRSCPVYLLRGLSGPLSRRASGWYLALAMVILPLFTSFCKMFPQKKEKIRSTFSTSRGLILLRRRSKFFVFWQNLSHPVKVVAIQPQQKESVFVRFFRRVIPIQQNPLFPAWCWQKYRSRGWGR